MQYYFTGEDNATYRWDLGVRTDGQPIYQGKYENPPDGTSAVLEAHENWIIHYFQYTTVAGTDILTSRKIGKGSWNNRSTTITYR